MLARDLQSIVLYDLEGKLAGIHRLNSKLPIDIDGNKIVIVDAIGSTGLDLKVMDKVFVFEKISSKLFNCLYLRASTFHTFSQW